MWPFAAALLAGAPAPALASTPSVPDCRASTLDPERVYRAALTIASSNPNDISQAYVEKRLAIRLPKPAEVTLGHPEYHEFSNACQINKNHMEISLAIYRKYDLAGSPGISHAKVISGQSILAIAWTPDYLTCKSRDQVLADLARRGWAGSDVPSPPEYPDRYNYHVHAINVGRYRITFNFGDTFCLSRVAIDGP